MEEKNEKGLSLSQVEGKQGLKYGIKSDGKRYTVRDNRNKYFFPDEWKSFLQNIKEDNIFIFDSLLMTGARVEEVLCIKTNHIRWDRNYLTLYITKIKAKKKETKPTPRDITFSVGFGRKLRNYINKNNLKENDYLFLDNSKIYSTRNELKKETQKRKVALSQMMKRALEKSEIPDWYMFSLHNIRKTHGMWLKALDVKIEEICHRLGHDYNTYLKHYGSTDIFDRQDKLEMIKIFGDIYNLK